MRISLIFLSAITLTEPAFAQCFNRVGCDVPTYELRSQLSVTIPLSDEALPADKRKAMDEAQHRLSDLSDRELDAVKSLYGSDVTLRAANTNSNLQENGNRNSTAFVSISNTYVVKKPIK